MKIENLFNNIEFMFSTFILIPNALAILTTYKIFCKNYGIAVNKPLWKKIVEAFLGIVFFSLVLACLIYYALYIKRIKYILICILSAFFFGVGFITLEHIIPIIHKKIASKKQKLQNNSFKKIKIEDKNSLIERLGNKKTVDYIRAILSDLSKTTIICYFIVVTSLLIIDEIVRIKDLSVLLLFWNNLLVVISTLSLISCFHMIFISINSNDIPTLDKSVDQVKKRLLD